MQVKSVNIKSCNQSKNSRLVWTESKLDDLMRSIKENGLLQPIGVYKKGTKYEVCYGNRRLVACKKLGWKTVPAVIVDKPDNNDDIDIMNLSENLQRENLTLQEVGRYIEKLHRKGEGLTFKEIAARLGVTHGYIASAASEFSRVPREFRSKIVANPGSAKKVPAGMLSMSSARAVEKTRKQWGLTTTQTKKLYKAAMITGFSYERVSDYADKILKDQKATPKQVVDSVNLANKRVPVTMFFSEDDYETLRTKFIVKGPFGNMPEVCRAIFNRKITTPVKCRS